MKLKKVLSVFLALTFIFSLNIMSATQPVLQKIFKDIFSVNAAAVEDLILQYAPEGTTDIALKANVTASSTIIRQRVNGTLTESMTVLLHLTV